MKHSGRRWQITALAVGLLSAYKSIVHLLKHSRRSFWAKLFKKLLSAGRAYLFPRKMQKANAQIYGCRHLGNTEFPTVVFLHRFCLFKRCPDFNEWSQMREWRAARCSTAERPKIALGAPGKMVQKKFKQQGRKCEKASSSGPLTRFQDLRVETCWLF